MFFRFEAGLNILVIARVTERPSFRAIHKIQTARKISIKWKFLEFRMLFITGVILMTDSMLDANERK